MVRHGVISASVLVDGAELPEYASIFNEKNNVLTCWIPSQTGKEFEVVLRRDKYDYNGEAMFFVDGKKTRGFVRWKYTAGVFRCHGTRTSATTMRPLIFSKNLITDDDTVQGIKIPPEQGDIRVEHWSVEKLPRNTQDRKAYGLYFAHADTVHESANPVAHVVTLGPETIVQPKKPLNHTRKIEHLLTIIFRYRPIECLQAAGIAPRLTLPPAEEEEDVKPPPPASSKKRKAYPDIIELGDSTESESEPADIDDDDDDIAEIEQLRTELEIKRMELRLSQLERQHRKKRKLNAEAHGKRRDSDPVKKEKGTPLKQEKGTPLKQEKATPVKQEKGTPVKQEKATSVKQEEPC